MIDLSANPLSPDFQSFFVRQGESDDPKPELLLEGLGQVRAENKPEKWRNEVRGQV